MARVVPTFLHTPLWLLGAALIALGGCQSIPHEPKTPTVLAMQSADRFTFPDEVWQLQPVHHARLQEMVAGAPLASTEVSLTTHDARRVNRQRQEQIAAALGAMGVTTVHFATHSRVPHRTVEVELRVAQVTAPHCPDWRGPQYMNFHNRPLTNLGCATATNLSRMVENPEDLLGRHGYEPADAERAATTVRAYREAEPNRLEIVGSGSGGAN